jgi:5-methylcytosine-specific restriction protein A
VAIVLFTWNPENWLISDRQWEREIKQIQDCGFLYSQWSCGRSKFIQPGDDAFLLRQGQDRRGIIARGTVTSELFEAPTWNNEKGLDVTSNYVDITWTTQLKIDQRLPIEVLQKELPDVHWSPQGSGTQIPENAHEKFLYLWQKTVLSSSFSTNSSESRNRTAPASEPSITAASGCCHNCHISSKSMYGIDPKTILVDYKGNDDPQYVALCRNCYAIAVSHNPELNIAELEKLTSILF